MDLDDDFVNDKPDFEESSAEANLEPDYNSPITPEIPTGKGGSKRRRKGRRSHKRTKKSRKSKRRSSNKKKTRRYRR
jgi:hypothetical protein